MGPVKPKKSLGQHFLTDKNIARKIVGALTFPNHTPILEIGPGTGVLTRLLLDMPDACVWLAEIDPESIAYLKENFPLARDRIIAGDVLKVNLREYFQEKFSVIGNFPYNISSQLFFLILDYRQQVNEVVCMVQKEVARRIASPPGSRNYGILSVFLQAYYDIQYLFTVPPQVFNPPPKVQSAVIRLTRNNRQSLPCDEALFARVVRSAFNQRRKVLRNSLREMIRPEEFHREIMAKRPEQLGIDDFILLTEMAGG